MINVFAISMIHGFRGLSSSEGFESPAAKLWLTMDLMTASAFEHSVKSRRCSLGVPRLPVLLRLMTGACSSGAPPEEEGTMFSSSSTRGATARYVGVAALLKCTMIL